MRKFRIQSRSSVQRKRLAKKKWDMDRIEENRQEYNKLQRRVKSEVSKAKQKAYDEYTMLDTREGQKNLYRLAGQRDQDGKDAQQVRVIKDRDGRVFTSEESVQRRWKEYFEELMNDENDREKRVEGVNTVEQKVHKIRKDEVRKALKRMKSGKAVGPDDILVEVWKCLGEAAVKFLTTLFNRVLENLEKAYDRVPREELWYCMRKSGVAEKYVRVVQDMYERSRTVVRCAVGQTEEFKVEVGLHQRSALSPFLFAMVMDQLSEEVRQESPWTMMLADDTVIFNESREQVEENLERWRFALERRGMKVSRMHNIIQRFRESGTISVCKGQGWKTILDARDLRALRRHYITYRNATVMEITTWAQEYFQKTLLVNKIHRAIRRCRLKLYRSKKKPYLNMIQKRRRFLWAKAHLKWTVAKWKTVLWSDESKFEVLLGKLGRHVIRTKEDKDNPSCYQRSVQKPASLMVWGCMSACDMGSLHIWKGTINAESVPTFLESGL
ncbi:hypothetical protein QTP70_005869 [Hemibagrus guttatus]|uniref:ribonuclease H n=1 Tax=Hemibagrus guttatus TaxID=175788 RepID=A0AAE0PYB2_9TELE|nr:hypothetical protein QTP70_005869 [Hemibagrus guttatus]